MNPSAVIGHCLLWLTLGSVAVADPSGRIATLGRPRIVNYNMADFDTEPQIWRAAQDKRGLMYFGANYAVLEFDGIDWRKIPLPTAPTEGLHFDKNGTLFLGMPNDLGYLAYDKLGEPKFVSLKERIPPEHRPIGRVYLFHETDDGVYFFSRNKTVRYHNDEIQVIDRSFAWGQNVHDSLLAIDFDGTVYTLLADRYRPIVRVTVPEKSSMMDTPSILPWWDGKFVLAIPDVGNFIYDLPALLEQTESTSGPILDDATHRIPLVTEIDKFFSRKDFVYHSTLVDDTRMAIAFRHKGLVILDRQGRVRSRLTRSSGLANNLVYSVYADQFKNVWACTNTGISLVEMSSPLRVLDEKNGIESMILSIQRFGDSLYVGTFVGVYRIASVDMGISDNPVQFKKVENTELEAWSFLTVKDQLLANNNNRIIHIVDDKAQLLHTLEQGVLTMHRSSRFEDLVFAGTLSGVSVLRIEVAPSGQQPQASARATTTPMSVAAQQVKHPALNKLAGMIFQIAEDSEGDLWASTANSGVYHIEWSGDSLEEVQIDHYTVKDGLPDDANNFVYNIDGHVVLGTDKGIFQWMPGEPKGRFVPQQTFGRYFNENEISVRRLMRGPNQQLWINENGSTRVGILTPTDEQNWMWDTGRFSMLSSVLSTWSVDGDHTVWLGTAKPSAYRYDTADEKDYDIPFAASIRRVKVGEGRVINHGAFVGPSGSSDGQFTRTQLDQAQGTLPELLYEENTIAFDFAAAFFEQPQATQYRYQLHGFDRRVSSWSKERRKEYTNLPEGEYRFVVTAKNTFDKKSRPASFRFSILAPWYRTIWAYLAYAVIALLVFSGGVQIYTWRLNRSRRRLKEIVRRRTAEVVAQKEEIKSQADELQLVNDALWGEMQLAKKIQTTLLPETPQIRGYEIAAIMNPADDVGGDYYDTIHAAGTDWIIIGDVSGHGVPAGLVMMMVQTSIHTALEIQPNASPADIFHFVNQAICDNIQKLGERKYMTMTIFAVKPDGKMYHCGLHQDILIYRRKTQQIEKIETEGFWIGMAENVRELLTVNEFTLHSGDAMLLYTDGITEARNRAGQMFTIQKVADALRQNGERRAVEIEQTILGELEGYSHDDDVTCMVVKRNPESSLTN